MGCVASARVLRPVFLFAVQIAIVGGTEARTSVVAAILTELGNSAKDDHPFVLKAVPMELAEILIPFYNGRRVAANVANCHSDLIVTLLASSRNIALTDTAVNHATDENGS